MRERVVTRNDQNSWASCCLNTPGEDRGFSYGRRGEDRHTEYCREHRSKFSQVHVTVFLKKISLKYLVLQTCTAKYATPTIVKNKVILQMLLHVSSLLLLKMKSFCKCFYMYM